MAIKTDTGIGIVGLIFLALGVVNFLQDENWIVWVILGLLMGGAGAARRLFKGQAD